LAIDWFLSEIIRTVARPKVLPLVFLSLIAIFFTLRLTPNLYQSFYWPSSGINHVLGIIGLLFVNAFLFWFMRTHSKADWRLIGLFIIALIIGGLAEITTVLEIIFLLVLLISFLRKTKIESAKIFGIFSLLAGFIIALIFVRYLPGNVIRFSSIPHLGISGVILQSIKDCGYFLEDIIWRTWREMIVIASASIWVGMTFFEISLDKIKIIKNLVYQALFGILLIYITFFVFRYSSGWPMFDRTKFYVVFIVICFLIITSFLFGVLLKKIGLFGPNTFLLILLIYSLLMKSGPTMTIVSYINGSDISQFKFNRLEAKQFGQKWDKRDILLKGLTVKKQDVKNYLLPNPYDIDDLFYFVPNISAADADYQTYHWINDCIGSYYNIEWINKPPD
jgi:hypothetical protein